MPDTLFGIPVPLLTVPETPANVFPYDPDFNFKKTRSWSTGTLKISPVLEQRYTKVSVPSHGYEVGFANKKGRLDLANSPILMLYQFFLSVKGRGVQFYFYDPRRWSKVPAASGPQYGTNPLARIALLSTVSNGVDTLDKTSDRYLMQFDEDEMSIELFDFKLNNASLKMTGFPG